MSRGDGSGLFDQIVCMNKAEVHNSSSNYRGIMFTSYTMKLCERVVKANLRRDVTISKQ